jgi:hypothetical protein
VDSEHGNLVVMVGHTVPNGLEFISTHQRADRLLVDRVSLLRAFRDGYSERKPPQDTENRGDCFKRSPTVHVNDHSRAA